MQPLQHSAKAFGDGTHPTTRLLLEVIAAYDSAPPKRAIDIGCGSGILSLAVAERFGCPIIACDTQSQSIEATQANARSAGVAAHIACVQADGFSHPIIAENAPYDLIMMNILAEPLVRLAHDAYAHAAPESLTMLSGILAHQKDYIIQIYQSVGFELLHSLGLGDWVALLLAKP